MKITEITASFGRTKQIAPYEPINFHCSYKAEIAEGEDVHEATAELFDMAKKDVRKQEESAIIKKDAVKARVSETAMKNAKDVMLDKDEERYQEGPLKDDKGNHFF